LYKKERQVLVGESRAESTWRHIAASRVFRMQVRYNRSVLACEKRYALILPDVDGLAHAEMKRGQHY
jgi:hypothetical protein